MPINKTGSPNKIRTVVSSEKDFEHLKEQIVSSNKLARCNKCGKLLAKMDNDLVSVKRKDIDLIAKVQNLEIKCPVCNTTNQIIF
jgi:phage FluMu protein Com